MRIPQTDDPLSVPTLKVSQKDADKMQLSWSKVEGAAGYVIYRYDHAVKTVKASVLSWGDKDGYSGAGSYWTFEYCVRAYKIVNGKRDYSKKIKTVTI